MSNQIALTQEQIAYVLSPECVRERAKRVFALCEQGKTHFKYNKEKLEETVLIVLETIKKNYPSLEIPFHSRWGHFRVGGKDRVSSKLSLHHLDSLERARTKLDLVITSVLLDAGAGDAWRFKEEGDHIGRSEGLALASLDLFVSRKLSSSGSDLRADSEGLKQISSEIIEKFFQVSSENPLVGVKGRATLLQNLGIACENSELFAQNRPGNILDYLIKKCGKEIPAKEILKAVLFNFGPIWPERLEAKGQNLGDTWLYTGFGTELKFENLVCFHKLSQWLSYSLIEPIEEAGVKVTGVDELTGLAEYRNGGLFIDSGLISLRDPSLAQKSWRPNDDLILEWRALTVCLLDVMGQEVCQRLKKPPTDFPLAKVLEGGTWWAGRALAKLKRPDTSSPPLNILSDGSVF